MVLHCGMHCYRSEGWPKVVTPWFEFTGLQTTGHGAQLPIALDFIDKESPITKGMENWTTIKEELYNNIAGHVLATAHPLVTGAQGTNKTVVAWTNLYNGKAKVFATTIGHNNETCADPRYLQLVTRGLLWSVGKLDDAHMKPAKQIYIDGKAPVDEPRADAAKPAGPKADANGMVPLDLARGKKATASTSQTNEDHSPAMAFDGDGDTRWCASGGAASQWLQVDLGKPQDLTSCMVTWEKDHVDYHYKIEGSADGQTWTMLSDQTDAVAANATRVHEFVACCGKPAPKTEGIRFVRLTTTALPDGCWASIFDFEVFGKEMVKATAQAKVTSSTTTVGKVAKIKAPPGFDVTVFAAPPDVAYCTAVSAAPSGAVFIGIDEDGSLGKKPGMGRVVRAVDSKGTGVADRFTVFAKMDHPRGLIWDDGKLFVLHPPYLSVYYDDNNTGVANRSEVLVTGISNEKMVASRGADHTTNGIRLGIDGWIYIATGDFGCYKAVAAKDGTQLQFHYGGILRIRPDGTGLEVYSYGTRNIYDVAMDPLMNVFTRDNTNDGDDWNDRLAYDVPTGYYGYPSRFMHFPGEFIDCLADYGGGAPCGSIFLDEPGIPGGLYTVEWGNSQIDHHPLLPNGANFKVAGPFEKFMDLPRGTDLDVDCESHLYATSWANGGFDYSGPNVGYVARISPKNYKAEPFPNLRKLADADLLKLLTSKSHTQRLTTQREILRRGDNAAFDAGLISLINSDQPLAVRVAAIFTLRLLHGDAADATLAETAAKKADLREFAMRAMVDKKNDKAVPAKVFVDGLTDPDPRVRLVAVWGLGRLGRIEAAPAMLPLTADSDFLVSHVAMQALVALNAQDVCLGAVEPSTSPSLTAGALRVLKQIHDVKVVNGLLERVPKLADPATRALGYAAICRLCFREADWDAGWWGTRPDRTGPYYKNAEWEGTPAVKTALHHALETEKPEVVRSLIVELQRHQIVFPETAALISKLAATDPGFQEILVDMLSSNKKLDADQVSTLLAISINDKAAAPLRAKAIRVLIKEPGNAAAMDAGAKAIAPLLSADKPAAELATLRDEYIHDPRFARDIPYFAKLAETESPARRELAYSVLMNLNGSRLVKPDQKAAAAKVIDKGWDRPAYSAIMLRAVARTHADAYGEMVQAMLADKNPDIAQAAALAADKLGLKHGPVPPRVLIESMKYEDVVAQVLKIKGDPALGHDLFQRQGCIACHTTSTKEPQKGPMLGGISGRYNRSELCESIMKPSAKIAQGFETQWFKTNDGDVVEGFVSREGGDDLEIRNPAGVATTLKKKDIAKRGKRDISMMPEGLVVKLTPEELASLIAYLESTTGK
ncbi:MAG TPA: discoidin domain-containing protein [Tepidisphaeraceae bacterium]|nr:discoidin domain-containing protein [Tepidisphaeraceae bacterium]